MTEETRENGKASGGVSVKETRSRSEIWRDGLYSVRFFREGDDEENGGEALAVLRDGSILGSDKFGGVFEGRLVGQACGREACLSLHVRIPPGGVLVTGKRVGSEEAVLDVVGRLSQRGEVLSGICKFDGERLVVSFRYIGLLPQ